MFAVVVICSFGLLGYGRLFYGWGMGWGFYVVVWIAVLLFVVMANSVDLI